MIARRIIDAGPALNFLSVNKERLLISVLGRLSAPETVEQEVHRRAGQDPRFAAAPAVWAKLNPKWIEVLPDDPTPALGAVVRRISGSPIAERLKQRRDLGETMVIAHAVVAAEAGADVVVLIDESAGAQVATSEMMRLDRMRSQGRSVGSLKLVSTLVVLEAAAGGLHLPDRASMKKTYERLRACDDGLVPYERTGLAHLSVWRRSTGSSP